jgi:hypothetical protein
MSLQAPENLIEIEGHKGAHGPDYNKIILSRLKEAIKGLLAHTEAYKEALKQALRGLKQELAKPGSQLNRMITGGH